MGLSLGEAQVRSSLDQPLLVEIELKLAPQEQAQNLELELADPKYFHAQGLPYPVGLKQLNIETRQLTDGRWLAQLRSNNAIDTPLLSLMLKAKNGSGELLKSYDLFLSPAPEQQAIVKAPTAAKPVFKTKMNIDVEKIGLHYGPVQPGDTLSTVAVKMRGQRPLQLNALVAQLHHDNPDAFINKDVNRLRVGSRLYLAPQQLAALPLRKQRNIAQQQTIVRAESGRIYGPVKAGDSLSIIAQQLRPDPTIPLTEAMEVILAANPDAFIQQNPSLLKQGKVLHYPTDKADIKQPTVAASTPTPTNKLQRLREQMQSLRAELQTSVHMVQQLRQQNVQLQQQTASVEQWLQLQHDQLLAQEMSQPDPKQLLAQAQQDNPFNHSAMFTALGGLLLLSMPLFSIHSQRKQRARLPHFGARKMLPAPRTPA